MSSSPTIVGVEMGVKMLQAKFSLTTVHSKNAADKGDL